MRQEIRFSRTADDVRIAYATAGHGPPLVKAANYLTHLEHDWESPVWRPWLRELAGHHTLVRYDERGCGLSDRDVEEFSMAGWLADLEAVVDAAGLDTFALLGLSQGAAVSVAYADRHPEREREVLERVARGLDNDTIAGQLHLTPKTVRNYVSRIYDKLGVPTRARAIVVAREAGLGRGTVE